MTGDIDVLNLYPLQEGNVPPSSAMMNKFSKIPKERQKIFLLDEHYNLFRENKVQARLENLNKYYARINQPEISKKVNNFLVGSLLEEYPEWFTLTENGSFYRLKNKATNDVIVYDDDYRYMGHSWGDPRLEDEGSPVDVFDWIAMQVPCDLVVYDPDRASMLHLMSPSGWSAEWALGKSFGEIHDEVLTKAGLPVIKNPERMVQGVMRMSEATERVGAISFRSTWELNRHPANKPPDSWSWGPEQEIYLRFERQTVMPLGNCFLFTIRSYYNDLAHPLRIEAASKSMENIHENNYARDFLNEHAENLRAFLEAKRLTLM